MCSCRSGNGDGGGFLRDGKGLIYLIAPNYYQRLVKMLKSAYFLSLSIKNAPTTLDAIPKAKAEP